MHKETLIDLYSSCNEVISLWIEIKLFFTRYVQLSHLPPQIDTFGIVKGNDKYFLIQNKILMVFKMYVYKSKVRGTLIFNTFLQQLVTVNNIEKGAAFSHKQKQDMFLEKWSIVGNLLP